MSEPCPHADPFMYCDRCVVDPCPIGLGPNSLARGVQASTRRPVPDEQLSSVKSPHFITEVAALTARAEAAEARATAAEADAAGLREVLDQLLYWLGKTLDHDFALWSSAAFAGPRHIVFNVWKQAKGYLAATKPQEPKT